MGTDGPWCVKIQNAQYINKNCGPIAHLGDRQINRATTTLSFWLIFTSRYAIIVE